MWKQIESYIKQHRRELDIEEPSPHIWEQIEQKLDTDEKPKYVFTYFPYWKVAAIILITILLSYLGFHFDGKKTSNQLLSHMPPDSIKDMWVEWQDKSSPSELSDLELFYTMQESQYWMEIDQFELTSFPFSGDYLQSLEQLEQDEQRLKLLISERGINEHLLEAIIKINRQKLDLLENLLLLIEKTQEQQLQHEGNADPIS